MSLMLNAKIAAAVLALFVIAGDAPAVEYIAKMGVGYKHDSNPLKRQDDYLQDGIGLTYELEFNRRYYARAAIYKQLWHKNKPYHEDYRTEVEFGYYFYWDKP